VTSLRQKMKNQSIVFRFKSIRSYQTLNMRHLWMILFCLVSEVVSSGKRDIQVYVHIGPHKTGSTAFHNFVFQHSSRLSSYGVSLPFPANIKPSPKSFSRLPLSLVANISIASYTHTLLSTCNNRKLNKILLSAEDFIRLNSGEVRRFKELFDSISECSFSFTIIFIYREWLNRVYSFYNELAKKTFEKIGSFSNYLFVKNFGSVEENIERFHNTVEMINTYATVFDLSNILIVDYYGMKEENAMKERGEASMKKKDISSVILCEIMKLEDSFCSTHTSLFQEASDRGMKTAFNKSVPGHLLHFIAILRDYFLLKGYCFSSSISVSKLIDRYSIRMDLDLPFVASGLSVLRSSALMIDSTFRRFYESKILYSNPNRTIHEINNFQATEINLQQLPLLFRFYNSSSASSSVLSSSLFGSSSAVMADRTKQRFHTVIVLWEKFIFEEFSYFTSMKYLIPL
jgi:hypothetical protein